MRIILWCLVWWCGVGNSLLAQRISTDSLRRALVSDSLRKTVDSAIVKPVIALKDSAKVRKFDKVLAIFKKDTSSKINPRRVTIHSAILPGWGQYDVKQWWLIPPIYAGFVLTGIAIDFNQTRYKTYVNAYIKKYNDQKAGISGDTTISGRVLSVDRLRIIKDGYRRNRDLSYMVLVGVWALQIIEANVAAHLKTFDVSENLSLKIHPTMQPALGLPTYGAKFVFTLNNRKKRPPLVAFR
ncbi:MAG: DUF5683 domain-containing protein [Spirosomataceae bacterium]